MFDAALLDDDIAGDALAGLRASPKTLPPKLFYDARGVELFDAITRLPEYYVTRTERALLNRIAPELVALARPGTALVEYGACDESKAVLLLDQADAPFSAYVPVDVARGALEAVRARMAASHPWLDVAPVCGDFMRELSLPQAVRERPLMGFFPGSTIGNLDPDAAVAFLRGVRKTLGEGGGEGEGEGEGGLLVVGADVRKGSDMLLPAYDDAQGVTAAFNLNVLRRLNREAGADFDLRRFRHVARWNDALSRVEMHLESLAAQTVRVGGAAIRFAQGETIHTENSYKHSLPAFDTLVRRAGWTPVRCWTDDQGLFGVHVLRG